MKAPDWGYFVYYRIDPERRTDMPWAALFAAVERRTGVAGRLFGPAPDGRTWMEVYEPVPAARREDFERDLAAAVTEAGMDGLLPAGERRHAEAFPRAAGDG
ncbi:MAG TPA: DUF4936 family protein [Gammaproteobacteria bacterium]|nr:DUF4936 family protein [Gammaproteobacteria bacterium]